MTKHETYAAPELSKLRERDLAHKLLESIDRITLAREALLRALRHTGDREVLEACVRDALDALNSSEPRSAVEGS